MTARLPEELKDTHRLEDMVIGQVAYVVPWAMWVTLDGSCWLNGKYTYHDEPSRDTIALRVCRTPEGFIVDISACQDRRWRPGESGWTDGLPVAEIRGQVKA